MTPESPAPDMPATLHPQDRGVGTSRFPPRFLRREHLFGQIVRFGLVGVLNTVVDFAILNLLYHVVGLPLLLSNTISVSAAIVNSFLWNRYWTFKAAGAAAWHKQMVPFLVVSLTGLLINTAGLWILHRSFGGTSVLAVNLQKLGASVVSLVWNFIGYRLLAFRRPGKPGTAV